MATYSTVTLGGITFDLDPESYQMLDGKRRGSVHRMLDGTTVYQDIGIPPSDLVITFSGTFINLATLKSLWALYRNPGVPMTFVDFKGNQFSALFTPGINSFQIEPIRGSNSAYKFKISLSVISVLYWFSTSAGYPSASSGP